MACSCRTAALRIFVQTITHIHVPLHATARVAQQPSHSLLARAAGISNNLRTASLRLPSSRTLHTSCARNSAAGEAAASATEEKAEHNAKQEDGESNPKTRKAKTKAKGKEDEVRPSQPEDDAEPAKPKKKKEPWMIQKEALKKKFPEGWMPRKRLSPDALVGIRLLHKQFPEEYTTEVLAQKFEVSPEAIRRILKSKWEPTPEEEEDRQRRWFNRGKRVWAHWAALGKKPPRKWRAEGIVRDPIWNRPRGPNHKDKAERAEAQRRLAKAMMMG